ncbi:MAG: 8-amino-7-oxononanoate synthase [Myxococcales bacterium]|nr:8-amino-7-oxononanoate synthase [Myxococcales bacterium]
MKHPPALGYLADELGQLERDGLLRTPPDDADGLPGSFCSNDYLGFARETSPVPDAFGATASRLVCGTWSAHRDLEVAIAGLVGLPAALAFTSGYAANVGLLSAVLRPEDQVVSDALLHASLIDGMRLSHARVEVVPHLDVHAVRDALRRPCAGRRWVVTESYFSMDADTPDLGALREATDAAGAALVVDEAHALGVLGPEGRGLCAAAGVVPDALTVTLGKSFGGSGALVAGSENLRAWLWNRARSFIFSTGMSPLIARTAAVAVERVRAADDRRAAVAARAEQLREGLRAVGLPALGYGPIVPVVVGEPARAVALARALRRRGVFVQPIRPPSVPAGTARLRFTVTAAHSADDVAAALGAMGDAIREVA